MKREDLSVPDFSLAGASKTGSEWLRACLNEHPEVFIPVGPTLDFFSKNFERGADWYLSHFKGAGQNMVTVEKSTSYLVSIEAPRRIREWNPEIGVIFVFREPVARAYSHYRMERRAGRVQESPVEALTPDSRLVEEGLYWKNLSRFREQLSDDRIHVFFYDDLVSDPEKFIAEIYGTLGVNPGFRPDILDRRFHRGKGKLRFPRIYRGLVRAVRILGRKSRFMARVIHAFRQSRAVKIMHKLNRAGSWDKLPSEKATELARYYQKDVERLAEYTGRDLSHWWGKYFP